MRHVRFSTPYFDRVAPALDPAHGAIRTEPGAGVDVGVQRAAGGRERQVRAQHPLRFRHVAIEGRESVGQGLGGDDARRARQAERAGFAAEIEGEARPAQGLGERGKRMRWVLRGPERHRVAGVGAVLAQ